MIVRGYALPQVAADGVQTRLYPHQVAMLNEWNKRNAFLLVTKTGSGKTRATVLPVLKNHESAVFVYPTNALIQDQARSIRQLMEEEEITFREFTFADIASIRGLSARSSRDLRNKLLVIGTSAIEVGIDFQVDYLLFEAGDASSFMQRFGRIGRHRKGTAFLLGDYRECKVVMSLGKEISRDGLERHITEIYPQQNAKAWFVDTLSGAFTVIAQADNFRKRIMDDRTADDAVKEQIDAWLDESLETYAAQMRLTQIKRARIKARRRPSWLEHYEEIDSFRTSLLSQEVWDVREKENDRDWCYDADVKALLTRAERLWFNEKHGRLYVKGYGKYRRVWFAKSFEEEREEDCCGILRTTADYVSDEMQFIQEGHLTSVSHVMAKPKHHIFVLVPADIIPKLDWRLTWFRCGSPSGRYIIAFDGDAFLLKEIYYRFHSETSKGD